MPPIETITKTVYLLAWIKESDDGNKIYFEVSSGSVCRSQGVVYGGIRRGDRFVMAFCDYIHGDDYLNKIELQEVARCYLDNSFITHDIDLRY